MKTTRMHAFGLLLALAITMPATVWSQERIGVATTVVGSVTIAHVAASPAPLKFKDDVFLNDRVVTGDNAFARMLLGGKAVVTARERSVVIITEVPGVSTIDLVSGRISVAVDKARMRPGEIVEIKTPYAIAGIRGTIVVAEALNSASTITVLRGLVDVYRRDPVTGNPVGSPTPVGARETVSVKANTLPSRPQTITVDKARGLSNEFTAPVRAISPSNTMAVSDEVTRAQAVIGALAGPVSSGRVDPVSGRADAKADKADKTDTTANGSARPVAVQPVTGLMPTVTTPAVLPAVSTNVIPVEPIVTTIAPVVTTTIVPVITAPSTAVIQPNALRPLLKTK